MLIRFYLPLTTISLVWSLWGCSPTDDRSANLASGHDKISPMACSISGSREPIRGHFDPGEVTHLCQAAIDRVSSRLTKLSQISPESRSIANTLLAFEKVMADFNDEISPLTFTGYTSTTDSINEEGTLCEEKVGELMVSIFTRRDLYGALSGLKATQPAHERLLGQTLKGFEQNGLKLDDTSLAVVKELKTQLSNLESKFSSNLNSDSTTLLFSKDELVGATDSFLSRLEKNPEGLYLVTTKSTDYLDVLQNVSLSSTRKRMMEAYLNRGGEANTQLLESAIQLRSAIAKELAYETWADYRVTGRMAQSSEKILVFLNDLKEKLKIRNRTDMQQLLDFKKQLVPGATSLDPWDNTWLSYQLQKKDFELDNEKIREYFPAQTVTAGLFEVYSKLLGVRFVEVPNAVVWAEGVRLYEIHSASDCQLIAYFYADFIPRPGKYGHAAAFPLITGRALEDGSYSLPISSIVANFTPPQGGRPSLLTHDEVETLFHEFGHIMHQTLTRAPFSSLAGTSVAQDFVEAPSQMLENWVWNPKILNQISGHYLNPKEKLPAPILKQMLAARNFQQGAKYMKQLLYALFDMKIHSQTGPVDVTRTYNDLYREVLEQEPLPGNHFPASFGHLMGGYDAGYYGYLWSEVYAQDMFSFFPQRDLTDSSVGQRYRETILEVGNMKEAPEMLKDFLERDPSPEAFFKMLGL